MRPKKIKVADESPNEVKVEVKKNYTIAKVLAPNGYVIRTYDLETHGEGFAGCAKSMSEQHKDSTIELT